MRQHFDRSGGKHQSTGTRRRRATVADRESGLRFRRLGIETLEDRRLLTVSYTVTDLGVLPGGSFSLAFGINSRGEVVGGASTANGEEHAFLYNNGKMYDLGVLSGGTSSNATAINDSGQIVGNSSTPGNLEHPFIYSNGVMQDLGLLPGAREGYVNAINNSGQAVGEAAFADQQFPAVLYSNGTVQNLGTISGPWSAATGINDSGVIAGSTNTPNNLRAFIEINGVMQSIGLLPNGVYSDATAINNNNQIAGYGDIHTGVSLAMMYSNGKLTFIGTFPGGINSFAEAINDAGQVVGFATLGNGAQHGFLYEDGQLIDLNSLIDPASGWVLEGASGINDAGQIVGYGLNADGETHAYLMSPIVTGQPPTVADVSIGSTSWSSSYLSAMQAAGTGSGTAYEIPVGGAAQLQDLPWTNLNQVQIKFDQNVNVSQNSLSVTGVNVSQYSFASFSYNSTTFTATWTLSKSIGKDKLSLHLQSSGVNAVTNASGQALDGEWTNGLSDFPSGNGTAGGDFTFSVNVLPGDVNHVGIVNGQDLAALSSSWLSTGASLADINGDGVVNTQDLAQISANWFATLPVSASASQQATDEPATTEATQVTDSALVVAATVANEFSTTGAAPLASVNAIQPLRPAAPSVATDAATTFALTSGSTAAQGAGIGATASSGAVPSTSEFGPTQRGSVDSASHASAIDSLMQQQADFNDPETGAAVDAVASSIAQAAVGTPGASTSAGRKVIARSN
jgi:probable HAF family extracellular repeat protein